VHTRTNAFIGTVLAAYENHLHLILTPDDFWLVISLGVAQFVNNPKWSEKYRKTFVDHEGKMLLMVSVKKLLTIFIS
jgi:hypothetical protein